MPSGLILALDQGTTNTKALLLSRDGEPVFRASCPVALIHAAGGHVEQDPEQLWSSVLAVIAECVRYATETGRTIEAVAISNQRETSVAWDGESGGALADAISWQCVRSAAICRRLAPHTDAIRAKTGLPLATLISAGKWAWLLENNAPTQAAAKAGTLRFGTVDSWLIHKLTKGAVHATDASNASRTGLLDLESGTWDSELLQLFGIPSEAMPEVRPSSGNFGICIGVRGLENVPITAAIGDSHAAMFGHGRYAAGAVKATYGTGSSLMALTPSLATDTATLARTIAWRIDSETQFALEGNIAMTGSAVQWVGEFLQLEDPTRETAAMAASINDSDGVYFVPAMVGLGAPYWESAARGTITGLGRSHKAAHLARAAVEAIAYQVADVFFAMERASGIVSPALHADGGATRNSMLMQFQADMLSRPVYRSSNEELSAIGAAYLAGLASGWWASVEEISSLPRSRDEFVSTMNEGARKHLYTGWQTAVARALMNPEVAA